MHLNHHARADLAARAMPATDAATRRAVFEHPSMTWYRAQQQLYLLVEAAPMVEIVFAAATP